MTSILLFIAVGLSLLLAMRGPWRRDKITALAVAKVPGKMPTSKSKEQF